MKTLIITGGGTAGHVTPLLAVLPLVKNNFDKIVYIGSGKEIEKKLIEPTGAKIINVNPPAFKRSICFDNFLIPTRLLKAVKQCKKILKEQSANVIFSKGGYCALPVCLAGFSLQIPVVCHESDLSLGLANKLTKNKCSAFFTSFEQTAKKHGGVYCGPPIRHNLLTTDKQTAKNALNITGNKPVLLITGGSQGSKTLNQAVFENLHNLTRDFTIIHQCGKGNKPAYSTVNNYFVFEFLDMGLALCACDFCVTRGGSNSIFEILYAKKPCIAIPLKKGSRGDQIKNVLHFEKQGALIYADEDDLNKKLMPLLKKLLNEQKFINENIKNLKIKNGAVLIAQELKKFGK